MSQAVHPRSESSLALHAGQHSWPAQLVNAEVSGAADTDSMDMPTLGKEPERAWSNETRRNIKNPGRLRMIAQVARTDGRSAELQGEMNPAKMVSADNGISCSLSQ